MIQNPYSRMFVRMPLYVGQWLRTKYMSSKERLMPVRLPEAHRAGRIIYTSLISNSKMLQLTTMCYSAQMFGINVNEIPPELIDLYPKPEERKEFVAISLYASHFFLGRWICDDETMQLSASDTTQLNAILLEEMWTDLSNYWESYTQNFIINHPNRTPAFYDCLLDFCELYQINIDAVDSMYRAYKRRKKKLKEIHHGDGVNHEN